MRRRLDIAMSLIGNPPVLFLDEPTTDLDPQSRIEVWKTVPELAGQGTTVLLTTQYLDEAEHLADRIAVLHEGRIIANGTLTAVIHRPGCLSSIRAARQAAPRRAPRRTAASRSRACGWPLS